MDAAPILARVAAALAASRLQAVLIGNAAAALQGAPVTTDDLDFMFRATAQNVRKLQKLAELLSATVSSPYYPLSDLYRLSAAETVQVDMMGRVHGIRSFESLRSRADEVRIGNQRLLVARLDDIIKSKRAAGRRKDMASLPVLEETLREQKAVKKK
jgi:predicted nucleotidyltransferase